MGGGKFRVSMEWVVNLTWMVFVSKGQVILKNGATGGGIFPEGNLPQAIFANDVVLDQNIFGFVVFKPDTAAFITRAVVVEGIVDKFDIPNGLVQYIIIAIPTDHKTRAPVVKDKVVVDGDVGEQAARFGSDGKPIPGVVVDEVGVINNMVGHGVPRFGIDTETFHVVNIVVMHRAVGGAVFDVNTFPAFAARSAVMDVVVTDFKLIRACDAEALLSAVIAGEFNFVARDNDFVAAPNANA